MLNLAMRVEDANMVGQGSESNWSIVKKISKKERELRIILIGELRIVVGNSIRNRVQYMELSLLMADGFCFIAQVLGPAYTYHD